MAVRESNQKYYLPRTELTSLLVSECYWSRPPQFFGGSSFSGFVVGQLFLSLTTPQVALPRLLHGAVAAATDIWLCDLTRMALGNDYVSAAVRCEEWICFFMNSSLRTAPFVTVFFLSCVSSFKITFQLFGDIFVYSCFRLLSLGREFQVEPSSPL